MRANMKFSVFPEPKRGDSLVKMNIDHVSFPTPKRGDSRLRRIYINCSLHNKKEFLTTTVSQEHILSINLHRSCELNMKFGVFPTPKRGDLTGQSEIETYLALFNGNHRLVPMLARHSSKTRRHMETTYPPQWYPPLMRLTRASTSS